MKTRQVDENIASKCRSIWRSNVFSVLDGLGEGFLFANVGATELPLATWVVNVLDEEDGDDCTTDTDDGVEPEVVCDAILFVDEVVEERRQRGARLAHGCRHAVESRTHFGGEGFRGQHKRGDRGPRVDAEGHDAEEEEKHRVVDHVVQGSHEDERER